ncbi:hypothetical protein K503DRAFT_502344 [Rhizopogon vinicolor AM-OR11-026]|uniref:F-box domain-containing protein n=1 Tax=Rhizopogon vinicolor AM-OR11-026 TaxID=1314800 RepID=A0A1B7N960_9AGAM|nr:hypothetical protein K503DRAFT_502344 [Rhizopogon vinicolor AM-OR11-026]
MTLSSVEIKQHPVTSPSPLLPVEILVLILQPQWKRCEDIITWNDMVNVMLSCSLALRTLYAIARANLYNDIRLPSRLKSLRLFLRTVRESFGGHCPAHALHVIQDMLWDRCEPAKKYAMLAEEIISCCTELRYLELEDRYSPQFTSGRSLPEYPYLKRLKVCGLNIHFLAPLLPRLRNLESFEVIHCHSSCDLVEEHSPPSFKLLTLSISRARLSRDQCKWLFASSSQSIKSLKVQEVGASLGSLADVMGAFVKKLHINHLHDCQAISGFVNLQSLRIDEFDLHMDTLRDNMQSSLKTFAFNWSRKTIQHNVPQLLRCNWQPSLQSLDIYHSPTVMVENISDEARQRLVAINNHLIEPCAARGIQINWLP